MESFFITMHRWQHSYSNNSANKERAIVCVLMTWGLHVLGLPLNAGNQNRMHLYFNGSLI